MPLTVALVVQPPGTYTLLVVAIAALLYAGHVRPAFVPGFAGVSAALLAGLGYAQFPPSAAGLGALASGVLLMNVEFRLPTFGCAGLTGVILFVCGSWCLLEPAVPALRLGLAVASACLLLTTIARALRRMTLTR